MPTDCTYIHTYSTVHTCLPTLQHSGRPPARRTSCFYSQPVPTLFYCTAHALPASLPICQSACLQRASSRPCVRLLARRSPPSASSTACAFIPQLYAIVISSWTLPLTGRSYLCRGYPPHTPHSNRSQPRLCSDAVPRPLCCNPSVAASCTSTQLSPSLSVGASQVQRLILAAAALAVG